MKTKSKLSAYVFRGTTAVLLFSCVIVAICWAISDQFGNPSTGLTVSYTVKGARPASVPPPPDMVSWWPGDGNTEDIINGNSGAFVGNATYATGEVGQAFSFDGSNYVEVPDAPNLASRPNAPITVDMWLYRTGGQSVMHFLGKRSGCGSDSGNYQIGYQSDRQACSGKECRATAKPAIKYLDSSRRDLRWNRHLASISMADSLDRQTP